MTKFTISSSIGKDNYKVLIKDTKGRCQSCPFKYCVAKNCKDYKNKILKNDDEISYLIKDEYKGEIMKKEKDHTRLKYAIQFITGYVIGCLFCLGVLWTIQQNFNF